MISFKNDYSELAHPNIFKLMNEYSNQQFNGYGLDSISEKAKDKIKKYFSDEVDIHFMIGGTSVNRTFISHVLKPYEAVISAETGHINVHETGAIESTGHKILLVKTLDGKLKPKEIEDVFNNHVDEHMVIPKLVYISNTTEIGTLYTKEELKALSAKCKELDLYLYLDGARLGVALTNDSNNLSLNDINSLTDAFYLGGTKNGALIGEAIIIKNKLLQSNFRHSIKQNGGMLAKGYLIGIQFEALFTDNLFFEIGKKANDMAKYLANGLKKLNTEFLYPQVSNQVFITLNNSVVEELKTNFSFETWISGPEKSTIRLVTSWFTTTKFVDNFLSFIKNH